MLTMTQLYCVAVCRCDPYHLGRDWEPPGTRSSPIHRRGNSVVDITGGGLTLIGSDGQVTTLMTPSGQYVGGNQASFGEQQTCEADAQSCPSDTTFGAFQKKYLLPPFSANVPSLQPLNQAQCGRSCEGSTDCFKPGTEDVGCQCVKDPTFAMARFAGLDSNYPPATWCIASLAFTAAMQGSRSTRYGKPSYPKRDLDGPDLGVPRPACVCNATYVSEGCYAAADGLV